ncbi:MAG: phosphoglycerate mutase [Chloroflexota bacterium]
MTTRLYLARHAETDANANGETQGWRDVPLNARGREQARVMAEAFRARPLAAIYASDTGRARDTAAAIAAPHGLEVRADPRLREMDQGLLDGLTGEQLRHEHATFLQRWRDEDPADLRMPEGETLREVQERMVAAVEAMAAAHPDASVLAVSHNLASKALLCHALGIPLAAFRRIHVDLASYAEIEVRSGEPWTVNRMNERCHLPGLLPT